MYNTQIPQDVELPSTKKLVKSTIIAAVSAAVVLVTVVMPAEYNIDPTGVGKVLGLTTMGEIKQSLAQESENGMGEAVSNTISSEAASDPNMSAIYILQLAYYRSINSNIYLKRIRQS
ncbi:Uncharacterised protein [Acinetobacter baumannii]|nr:Uncharacterised protein [Acinetobacter baumannii]